jgi:hypothetical protein
VSWTSISSTDSTKPPKGVSLFGDQKGHILNFFSNPDAEWKVLFPGSDILSTKRKEKEGAILIITGNLTNWTLATAESEYEPGHRLVLDVDESTAAALRVLFDSGPFGDADDARYPLVGSTVVFSTKLKSLQRKEFPSLTVNRPFPSLWDGCDLDGSGTPLVKFPANELTAGSIVAVETNLSSYTFPPKGYSAGREGYALSVRTVYILTTADTGSPGLAELPSVSTKRSGDGLVSPRKNKQAGQPAVFSDED